LDSDNFFPLPKSTNKGKIAFIDGGSAELLSAPNFAVGFTRVYFGLFRDDQRLESTNLPSKIDFYTVCYATITSNHINYKTEFVPVKEEWEEFLPDAADLEFNSFDQTLMSGVQRVAISRILDVARAFSEWRFSKFITEMVLERGDVIVRDGTLQTFVTNESKVH
jgi:hypothetical protein